MNFYFKTEHNKEGNRQVLLDNSSVNSTYFSEYVDRIYNLLKGHHSIATHNPSVQTGDVILTRKLESFMYETACMNKMQVSDAQANIDEMKSGKLGPKKTVIVYSEYLNLYSTEHLMDIVLDRILLPLQEKSMIMALEAKKYFISPKLSELEVQVLKDKNGDIIVKTEAMIAEDNNKKTLAKYRNRNVLMFELLPIFVADNKLEIYPIELILMMYIEAALLLKI